MGSFTLYIVLLAELTSPRRLEDIRLLLEHREHRPHNRVVQPFARLARRVKKVAFASKDKETLRELRAQLDDVYRDFSVSENISGKVIAQLVSGRLWHLSGSRLESRTEEKRWKP